MALLYRDGFEWIDGNNQINLRYQDCPSLTLTKTDDSTGRVVIPATTTRYGKSLSVTGGYGDVGSPKQVHFCRSLSTDPDYVIMGAGICDQNQDARHVGYFMFRDGSTDQLVVGRGDDWSIVVCRGASRSGADSHLLLLSELGRSAPGVMPSNAWAYLEVAVQFATDGTGSVEVRVNEETVLTLANVQTANSANAHCTAAGIGREYWWKIDDVATGDSSAETTILVDDLYIRDDTGGIDDDFAGDCVVTSDVPNANGTYTEFATLSGSSHWGAVDDPSYHDADSTYIEDGVVGHKDSFAKSANAFSSGTVHSVSVVAIARKSGSGARSIESLLRLSGTDAAGAHIALGDSYEAHQWDHSLDPAGNAWTISTLNSAEFGVAVAA